MDSNNKQLFLENILLDYIVSMMLISVLINGNYIKTQ